MQLFALELKKRGIIISIIALHYPYKQEAYSWNGIQVYPLNWGNKSWKRVTSFSKLKKVFSQIHAKKKVDIIHSFWLNETTLMANRIGKEHGIPHVASAMGQDTRKKNRHLSKITQKRIQTTVTCTFQKDQVSSAGIVNSITIPWGVADCITKDKVIDIIGVGNLTELKNFNYFIQLCSEINHDNFRAVIIGIGSDEVNLKAEIEKLGLNGRIDLLGQKSYVETLELISKSKVLVHPSKYEGFGMTIIEALASQTHVLAASTGISKNEPNVNHLQFDLKTDANILNELVTSPLPEKVHYDIKNTVDLFLKAYDDL